MQTVNDALGHKVDAAWGMLADGTAVIEMAAASGLELIAPARRDPMRASSHGVGELILAALDAGARHIILGLGGSATNDAGAGMLTAGARLLDAEGHSLPPGGGAGADRRHRYPRTRPQAVRHAHRRGQRRGQSALRPARRITRFRSAKGRNARAGAGAGPGAGTLCRHLRAQPGVDHRDAPGAGAAGGLGFAVKAFLGARFRPGVDIVAELGGLAQAVEGATLVFTGEGRMDAQTLRGKTPAGVARIARQAGVPVVALAGSLGEGYEALHACGISAAFSLAPGPITLQQALNDAERLLHDRARDVMRLWMAAQKRML